MAVDIFLKIDDIKGESADQDFTSDEIDVTGLELGHVPVGHRHQGPAPAPGRSTSTTSASRSSSTSHRPISWQSVRRTASRHATPLLTVRKAGAKPARLHQAQLFNVIVSSMTPSTASGSDDRQTESVSLHFGAFQYMYTPQDKDGPQEPDVT